MKFVVGSTGLLGSLVATKLALSHQSIAGLFREPISEKAWALASAGVKLIPGDLKDAASLDRALSGVDTVVCTASSTLSRRNGDSIEAVDHLGVQSLIASADRAGVRDFVFVSYDSDGHSYPLALAKQAAERRLRSSRLNWTIVQASFFCEIWFSPAVGFDRKAGSVRIYGNGDQGVNYIAVEDVAAAVVACIGNPATSRKVIKVGGRAAVSQLDAIRLAEQESGRKFKREQMTLAEIKAARAAATDSLTASFLGLFEQLAAGDTVDPSWQAQLGLNPQSVEDWFHRHPVM